MVLMEQFIAEISLHLSDIVQWSLNALCYFLIFLYRKKFSSVSTTLNLSMKGVLEKMHHNTQSVTGEQGALRKEMRELSERLHFCEEALKLYIQEGDNNDVEDVRTEIHSDRRD